MIIRSLTPEDDLFAVSRVYEESWKYSYRGLIPQDYLEGLSHGEWVGRLTLPSRHSLLAVEDGRIVGTVSYGASRFYERSNWGEVYALYLLPEAMGKGYGGALLAAAMKELRSMGYSNLFLWVLEGNSPARKFYEHMGFHTSGGTRQDRIGAREVTEVEYIARMATEITLQNLRRFLLLKQGLLGDYRFSGKDGALAYIRQAGCIQFDPIDICGRNAELTLQSRVKGVRKKDLYDLLYHEHSLVDYTDKELSIFPVEDWPYLSRWRSTAKRNGMDFEGVAELSETALSYIREYGPVSADELPIGGTIRWNSAIHWSGNWHGESKAARSILEQLYSEGRLIIHHKAGTRKVYDLAERHIPQEILTAGDPNPELIDHIKWGVLRRIGAIGTLWNRRSDALLGIWGMDAALRQQAFQELEQEGRILPVRVSELGASFYILAEDRPLLEEAAVNEKLKKRCELIAPLDPLMWDRKLIEAVFNFRYRWEIYVPADKRQYGYYVLPMIYGDRFVGRAEAVADRQQHILTVRHIWLEPGVRRTKAMEHAIHGALKRLARFNDCHELIFAEEAQKR